MADGAMPGPTSDTASMAMSTTSISGKASTKADAHAFQLLNYSFPAASQPARVDADEGRSVGRSLSFVRPQLLPILEWRVSLQHASLTSYGLQAATGGKSSARVCILDTPGSMLYHLLITWLGLGPVVVMASLA